MAEKVTKMVLKVDLQCPCCYKKIKKILAKFPEIKSHIYDEKQNTVTITVVCCNPEKIRCKLLCKGGKTIKCIEIIKEEPPKCPVKTTNGKDDKVDKVTNGKKDDKDNGTKKPPGGKTEVTLPPPKPPVCVPAILVCCGPCCEGNFGGPCYHCYGRPVPIPVPVAVPIIPKCIPARGCLPVNSVPDCCGPCSVGNPGGPCCHGHGRQVACCPPVKPVPDCCGPCSECNPGGPCCDGCGRQVPCYDGYTSGSGGCTSM